MKAYAYFFIFLSFIYSCQQENKLQVIQISSNLEKKEFTSVKVGSSLYYIDNIKLNNEEYDLIKKIDLKTLSVTTFINTKSKILKLNLVENIEEDKKQLAWISVVNGQHLTLNWFKSNNWLVVDLEEVHSLVNDFDFKISKIFLIENTIYFRVSKGTNRYLVNIGLHEKEVQIHSLEDGIGGSLCLVEAKRKILFSFLKPLPNIKDKNSVFVQSYDIDTKRVSEPILVHQSGENPSFSPQFISTHNKKVELVWEKSFGSIFNTKSLHYSNLNSEWEWSDANSVYHTERTILDYYLINNPPGLVALIHEYDIAEKEQYLIEFNFLTNTSKIFYKFREKAITFGEIDGKYILLVSSN